MMADEQILKQYGITAQTVYYNASPAKLYQLALSDEDDGEAACISNVGALITRSNKTGRSPLDKRIVDNGVDNVWWSHVNIKLEEASFQINRTRAIDYLNTRKILYVVDGFAGWEKNYRVKIRLIASQAYHALFMHNMLIRPTMDEVDNFGTPDYVIFNAGSFPANYCTKVHIVAVAQQAILNIF